MSRSKEAARSWSLGCAIALSLATSASAQDLLARGRYLMNSVVACGNCHTPRGSDGQLVAGRELAGGQDIIEEGLFVARGSNLTPDLETGIGRWSDAAGWTTPFQNPDASFSYTAPVFLRPGRLEMSHETEVGLVVAHPQRRSCDQRLDLVRL